MSERDDYPEGVPCWVEGLHRDAPAALGFYGALMGWELVGSGGEPEYVVARLRGRDVAGLATLPAAVEDADALWMTHVRVDDVAATAERATTAGGAVLAGPLDVPPAGRMVVLTDPTGARFCAWEPITREGAQLVNEAGAWSMSMLRTGDLAAAKAFYGAVFGWEAEAFGPPEAQISMLRLPGYVGGEPEQPVPRDVVAVLAPLQEGEEAAGWHVDFWVDDARGTAAHAEELGGRALVEPHDAPPFVQATLADPQGGTFSVSQLVLPA